MQKTKKINYIRKYRKILSLSIIVLLVIFTTAVPGVRGNTNEPEGYRRQCKGNRGFSCIRTGELSAGAGKSSGSRSRA